MQDLTNQTNMKRGKWTQTEIRHVAARMQNKNYQEISDDLGRSSAAVQQMASKIRRGVITVASIEDEVFPLVATTKKHIPKYHNGQSRNGRKWSNREIKYLVKTLHHHPERVGKKLQRTTGSIKTARGLFYKGELKIEDHRAMMYRVPWYKRLFNRQKI